MRLANMDLSIWIQSFQRDMGPFENSDQLLVYKEKTKVCSLLLSTRVDMKL